MDCNNSQRNACTCRPQMQTPPCMNTNCGGGCGNVEIQPRQSRPMQQVMPAQARPCGDKAPCQASVMPAQARPCRDDAPYQPPMAPVPYQAAVMGAQQPAMPSALGAPMRDDPLSCMPIAMAYVPWQKWKQTYSLEQGLNRGTIFPELDLPFVMGRCRG